jgi:hypothetical protein
MNNVQLIDKDDIKKFLTEHQIRRSDIDKHLFTNWSTNYSMDLPSEEELNV